MKIKASLFLFLISLIGYSQSNKQSENSKSIDLESIPEFQFGKGVGFVAPDSTFSMNMRFRIQNRLTYTKDEGEEETYQGEVKRLRLRFDGFIVDSRFLYAIQLSFAPGDVGVTIPGENVNIIRDAVVYYKPNDTWSFVFGQTKLPGNRQRINSSSALQFTDRTINNARFTIDRDFGIHAYYTKEYKDKFSYSFKSAISSGNGRNVTKNPDNGYALTGKIELFPFGEFTKGGEFFEGDIKREQTPKLMISTGFQRNVKARRTQGQTGSDLYEKRDLNSVFTDAMLKYKGWAFMAVYMNRSTDNAITVNPLNLSQSRYVYVGEGFDYQMSYLFKNNIEVAGRFSTQDVATQIAELTPDLKQYSIGLTKYFWEHKFKMQTELTLDELNFLNGTTKNNWYLRFQVEIGL